MRYRVIIASCRIFDVVLSHRRKNALVRNRRHRNGEQTSCSSNKIQKVLAPVKSELQRGKTGAEEGLIVDFQVEDINSSILCYFVENIGAQCHRISRFQQRKLLFFAYVRLSWGMISNCRRIISISKSIDRPGSSGALHICCQTSITKRESFFRTVLKCF